MNNADRAIVTGGGSDANSVGASRSLSGLNDHSNSMPKKPVLSLPPKKEVALPRPSDVTRPAAAVSTHSTVGDQEPVAPTPAPLTLTQSSHGPVATTSSPLAMRPMFDNGVAGHIASDIFGRQFGDGKDLCRRHGQLLAWRDPSWGELAREELERRAIDAANRQPLAEAKRSDIRRAVDLVAVNAPPASAGLTGGISVHRTLGFENGEVLVGKDGSVTFGPHRRETGLDYILPYDYDEAAECAVFDAFLEQITSRASNPAQLRDLIWQVLGYFVGPDRNMAIVVILLGGGANGKSVLIKVLERLLRTGAVLYGAINRMTTAPSSLRALQGRRLFVDTDVPVGHVLSDPLLKRMSESTSLTGRDGLSFENEALPVLICNDPPKVRDLTVGMQRRLVVIPCDSQVTTDEIDVRLFEKLIAELPGIMRKAIASWQVVAKAGRLPASEDVEAAKARLLEASNSILAFIAECCVAEAGASVVRSALFDRYRTWCPENGQQIDKAPSEALGQLGYRVKKMHGTYVVEGLRLKS